MILQSWNVNGIRAVIKNGFEDYLKKSQPDILCLQETRITKEQFDKEVTDLGDYYDFLFPAEKKGYSGVMVLTKMEPLSVHYGLGKGEFDSEGRLITLEFKDFYLLNGYFPNSQHGLKRLDYKVNFFNTVIKYSEKLRKQKPVVICGDLNVAHEEIDLANPKSNEMNPGFYIDERKCFTKMIEKGYTDTFRLFNKDGGNYSWWSYRFNARKKNIGWRIDYFVVSNELDDKVTDASICSDILGSDHCPIELELDI